MLLLASLFFAIVHNVNSLDEHRSFKYWPLRSFDMIILWLEVWHYPPCCQKDGFDLTKIWLSENACFSQPIWAADNSFLGKFIWIFNRSFDGVHWFEVQYKVAANLKPPTFIFSRILLWNKTIASNFFSVIGLNPLNFPKSFIISRIRLIFFSPSIGMKNLLAETINYGIWVKFEGCPKTFFK